MAQPVLIVFAGLPGTGKTTIARQLVARLAAVYLRIDTIEHALLRSTVLTDVGPAGYVVAYALARSNLALGMSVVADGVNPLSVTRQAWRDVAATTSSALLEVEIVCSDRAEHRRRVERRIAGDHTVTPPDWAAVLGHDYEVWTTSRLVIDSARVAASAAARQILDRVQGPADGL